MSTTILRIPTPLRSLAGGSSRLEVRASTVREALENVGREHTQLLPRLLNDEGELRSFVNVFLGSTNIRQLDGLDTAVSERDVLAILPAVAGGAR